MATVPITESDLKRAMRDPRYRQSGHPEREDWSAWVTKGWQGLENGTPTEGPGGEKVVRVRAYVRRRGGKTHHVGAYTQTRHSGGEEGEDAPPGLLNVSDAGTEVAEAPGGQSGPQSPAAQETTQAPEPALIFVGGLFDRWLYHPVGNFFELFKSTLPPSRELFDWDERGRIEAYIASLPPGTPVRLIGHSWGADTAAQIAAAAGEAGRPIDMLVTIDPVGNGASEGFFARVQAGAARWVNVNAAGGSRLQLSNAVAGVGNPWDGRPAGYANHWDAPFPHAKFEDMLFHRPDHGRSPSAWDLVRSR